MSEMTTKRRFWQIHLSTAIVVMLTAALLLYLNLVEHIRPFTIHWRDVPVGKETTDIVYFERGFPCTHYSYSPQLGGELRIAGRPWSAWERIEQRLDLWQHIYEPFLIANIAAALASVVLVALASECLVYRTRS